MDFVNNDHSKTALGRPVLRPLGQISDIVYPGMRGTVDFQDINGAAVRDLLTLVTGVTGVRGWPLFTVQGFGQEPGGGCFPHPARPGKQEGMRHALAADRIPQGAGNMLLPNDVIERLRSPLPGKDEIAHSMAEGLGLSGVFRCDVTLLSSVVIARLPHGTGRVPVPLLPSGSDGFPGFPCAGPSYHH